MKLFLVKHYKIIGFLVVLSLGFLVSNAFGAVIYERTPTGYTIFNPITFSVSVDSFEELNLSGNNPFWGIVLRNDLGCVAVSQNCVSIDTLSLNLTENFPQQAYKQVVVYGGPACGSCDYFYETGIILETDYPFEIIAPPPPPEYNILPVGSDFVSGLLAYAGRLFTDLAPAVGLLIGFAIAFWFIYKFLAFWRNNFPL